MERDFKGIWIPKDIWLSKELTLQEKVFLVEISSLDNIDGCFASNQYFANFFGVSKTRVSIIINCLVEKGYVTNTLIYKQGTKQILKRVLKVCYIPYIRKVKEGIKQNEDTPIKGKFKDNNTIVNNTVNNTNNKERVINFPFTSKKFYDTWEQWKEYKKLEHKFNFKSPQSEQASLMDLNTKSKQNENIACEIIMQSIANGWKGFFELKTNTNGNKTDKFNEDLQRTAETLANKYLNEE